MSEVSYSHFGHISNGELKGINKERFKRDLALFEGKQVEIILRRKKKHRSNRQNSYYHAAIVPAVKVCLYECWGEVKSLDETHELIKQECNYKEFWSDKLDRYIRITQSTTTLSTIEFELFTERARQWANEWFGANIGLPNEQSKLTFS